MDTSGMQTTAFPTDKTYSIDGKRKRETMPPLTFKELKTIISIRQVLQQKGLAPQFHETKDRLIGPCPIHKGNNPKAFVVDTEKNIWHCFACAQGGDLIDFVAKLDEKCYAQVARYLNDMANQNPCKPLVKRVQAKQNSCATGFKPFRQTIPLQSDCKFLRQKQIRPETAQRFEAGLYRGNGFLKDSIAVRLHDANANPIGYAARRLNANSIRQYGKWNFPPRLPKSKILYNYHRIANQTNKPWTLVECPWAVMRLSQLSIPAAALLGIQLHESQRKLLANTKRIIICLDGDQAGSNGARQIAKSLAAQCETTILQLPNEKDPDDLSDQQLRNLFIPIRL